MIRPISLGFLLLLSLPLLADDYYLIEMNTPGQRVNSCETFFWDADAVFYNLTSQSETVTLAGVSNGDLWPGTSTSLDVPAGRATSLRQGAGIPWEPRSAPPMWIIHITAPPSLLVESSMILGLSIGGGECLVPPFFAPDYGKTQLPVFRALVPANRRQLIGGLSIGDVPGHINVAIYNAGPTVASGTIEVHRACDGATLEMRSVTIDANTAQQFTGFQVPDLANACAPLDPSSAVSRLAYVVVTVDQPSVTFASILGAATVTNNQPVSTIQVMPGVAQ